MLRIAVCDDEPLVARQLEDMVRACLPDCTVTSFTSGGILLAAADRFDMILLDIQMDGLSGIETARQIRKRGSEAVLIFVTGAKEYVFDAFDVAAFHYLLKPVREDKLLEVLTRAAKEVQRKAARKEDLLVIRTRDRSVTVHTDDVLYLESAGRKLVLHTVREAIPFYGSISDYEKQLGPAFYRSHRSFLVNMARITEYDSDHISFASGQQAYLARERYSDFVMHYMRFLRNGGGPDA